jgi:hypothetical protein
VRANTVARILSVLLHEYLLHLLVLRILPAIMASFESQQRVVCSSGAGEFLDERSHEYSSEVNIGGQIQEKTLEHPHASCGLSVKLNDSGSSLPLNNST